MSKNNGWQFSVGNLVLSIVMAVIAIAFADRSSDYTKSIDFFMLFILLSMYWNDD